MASSETKHQTAQNGTLRPKGPQKNKNLAQQYGGNSRSGWLALLPDSWLPYVQLARLSPPAGLFLIYFPHLFGIIHAAILQHSPPLDLLRTCAIMLGGSFFVSNATHVWNDLIDAPLDTRIERTRHRPIPRGAVSPFAALVFTGSQAIGAVLFLQCFPSGFIRSALYALPFMVGSTYYPWAKLHTFHPQAVLGFCLAWGNFMGSLAIGREPFVISIGARGIEGRVEYSVLCLFVASILWTMIYDTLYAHQDLEDDLKVGVKSMAVLYRGRTKPVLWLLVSLMCASMISYGQLSGMGVSYYLVAMSGAIGTLSVMIARVDLKSSESCWWWFSNAFWFAGGSISAGLGAEYLGRILQ